MRDIVQWIFLSMTLILGQPAWAAFQNKVSSARSAGMGHSFMSSSREASALFANPAGLAKVASPELSLVYAKPFASLAGVNLNQGHAALVFPTGIGHLAVGYARFEAQELLAEQTLAFSYAASVLRRIHVGLTAKQLSHAYLIGSDASAAADPIFRNGASKSVLAFDAGLNASLGRHLKLGVAVRNLNEPNVGLVSEDKVSREIHTGLLLDMAGLGVKVTGDILMRNQARGGIRHEPVPFFGFEKSFRNSFALRAGANNNELTGGFGVKLKALGFDYAFVLNKNLVEDNMGSHHLGMTYRINKEGQ